MVTYVNKVKVGRYAGLSTEEKPLDVQNGSVYFEIDTGLYYMFDAEGKTWHEQKQGGGGIPTPSTEGAEGDFLVSDGQGGAKWVTLTNRAVTGA